MNDVRLSIPRKFVTDGMIRVLTKIFGTDFLTENPMKWILLREVGQRELLDEIRPRGKR
jgi:hypothetical protein